MSQITPIQRLLSNGLDPDTQTRQSAETQLKQLASENFGSFLLSLSTVLCDNNTQPNIRLMSATLIKNFINDCNYITQWKTLGKDIKDSIRLQILATLAVPNENIRRSTSLAIAGICKVDLPNKEWTEIFDILISTCKNDNLTIQMTSITTLGHILEEISIEDMQQSDILKVLNAFVSILNTSTADLLLIKETLKSIYHFNHLLGQVMQHDEQRKFFIDLILRYVTHPQPDLRQYAIQIMMELIRNYYDCFEAHIDNVIDFSYEIMTKDNVAQNAIYCYEIWGDIGLIEINRCKMMKATSKARNYCQRAYSKLLPIVLSHLLTHEYNDDDWTKTNAASSFLGLLAQCCDIQLVEKVIEYIGLHIDSSDADEKHAAILGFYSILETVYKDKMLPIVVKSLTLFVSLLESKEAPSHIKKISAMTIAKITECFGNYLWREESIFEELLMKMIELLFIQSSSIKVTLCNGIHYLVKAIETSQEQSTNVLSKLMSVTLSKLFALAMDKASYSQIDNVAISSFFAMGGIIEKAASDTQVIIQLVFKQLLVELESNLHNNTSAYPNTEKRLDYQQYLTSLLSSCMTSTAIEEESAAKSFHLIIESFKQRQCVYEEGICAIGSIAVSMRDTFEPLMTIAAPYLFLGFKSVNEVTLCHFSIYAACDIIQSIGASFSKYVQETLTIITQILSQPSLDKTIKLYSFNVVSDLFFFCTKEALAYFDSIMSLIDSAMQAAMAIPDSTDEIELIDYVVKLRVNLLETLSFIFTSIKEINKTMDFHPYVQPIVNFILQINSDSISASSDLIKYSIGLIGDFCISYQGNTRPLFQLHIIDNMLTSLSTSLEEGGMTNEEKRKRASLINWARQKIFQS